MKWAAFVLMISGCALSPQVLESPCADVPATTDGGACPACTTDADCTILSNGCYASASCVPRAGGWAVTELGCNVQHPAPMAKCSCVNAACRAN